MAIINFEELKKIRERHKDKRIVFCSGVFDLTHAGHVLFFEDCKKQGDILVVLVGDDASIRDLKGKGRPILNHHLRLKMLDSLKPVDYVLLGSAPSGRPLAFVEKVVRRLRPDKYVINDDAFGIAERAKFVAQFADMELVVLKRWCPKEFDGISTTKLLDKIKMLSSGRGDA